MSPCDIVDLLSILQYPTNVTICDIPRRVVDHGNKRESRMFFPNVDKYHDMLCEDSDENLEVYARNGNLGSFSWIS